MTTTLDSPATAEAPTRTRRKSLLRKLVTSREMGVALVLILVIAITTLTNPAFLVSGEGFRDLLVTPSILLVVVLGQAVVIITRSVDLSVGSILGLTAYLVGTVFVAAPNLPIPLIFLIGCVFGGLLGFINGALVAFGKVPAMVITLGTLYAFRGINVWWTGSNRINASDLPSGFLRLGTQQILGIPVLTIIALVALICVACSSGRSPARCAWQTSPPTSSPSSPASCWWSPWSPPRSSTGSRGAAQDASTATNPQGSRHPSADHTQHQQGKVQ